jgi:AraC-like DNA-binding protein
MTSNPQNIYRSETSDADHALAVWSFSAKETCVTKVVPDGCCDIIIVEDSKSPTWLLSELNDSVYDVTCVAGEKMRGIRLESGTQIDQVALAQWMKSHHVNELFIADQIDEFCKRSTSLSEILKCLSHEEVGNVQAVANELGVSLRTLQRVIKRGTQRTPYFWFSLARMRRAAKSLHKFDRLADVAAAFHFSDQAHMTRDMKSWLGLPPSQIIGDIELLSLLSEPGYA